MLLAFRSRPLPSELSLPQTSKNTTVARDSTQLPCQNDVKWDWCNLVRRAPPLNPLPLFLCRNPRSVPFIRRRHCLRWTVVYWVFRDKRLDSRLILMTYEVKPNDQGPPSYVPSPSLLAASPSGTFDNFRLPRRANRIISSPRTGRSSRSFSFSLCLSRYNSRYIVRFRGGRSGRGWRDCWEKKSRDRTIMIAARCGSRFPLFSLIRFACHPCVHALG